jgi:putative membrane protein
MKALAAIAVILVAGLHFCFMALEMFFWQAPLGLKIFSMTPEEAAASAVLAANQGLYNGFLAAGLVWGLVARKRDVQVFFLLCVIVAGLFGGFTAKPTIYLTQALPGAIALLLVMLASRARKRDRMH